VTSRVVVDAPPGVEVPRLQRALDVRPCDSAGSSSALSPHPRLSSRARWVLSVQDAFRASVRRPCHTG